MFGDGPRMIPLPNTGEWSRLSERLRAADFNNVKAAIGPYPHESMHTTYCTGCAAPVAEQFLDCSCVDRRWELCPVCHFLRCHPKQPCKCADGDDGAWNRGQDAARRAYHEGMSAAHGATTSVSDDLDG